MGKGKIRTVVSSCIIILLTLVLFAGCTKKGSGKIEGNTVDDSLTVACEPEGCDTDDGSETDDGKTGIDETSSVKKTSSAMPTDSSDKTEKPQQTKDTVSDRTEQNNITEPDSTSGQKQTSAQKQTDAKKETSAQKQTDAQKQTGTQEQTKVQEQASKPDYTGTDKYVYAYTYNDTSILSADELAVYSVASSVANAAGAQGSTFAGEKYVHDWICNNCRYDQRVFSGNMPDESYSEYGVFVNKTAVCEGYAKAFDLCMRLLGNQDIIVTGTGYNGETTELHAWNAVCLDGNWYQVDVTWDAPITADGSDVVSYSYFNVTDSVMRKDHTYTCSVNCTSTDYWYLKMLAESSDPSVCTSAEEVEAYIGSMLRNGSREITLKYISLEGNVQGAVENLNSLDIGGIINQNVPKYSSCSASVDYSWCGDYEADIKYSFEIH